MKKYTLILTALLMASMSLNAQTMKIYKGNNLVATYTESEADKVIFTEGSDPSDPQAPSSYKTCPDSHHPHLIDLGLPSGTKWACCNVEAKHPEDYGGYFSWGETASKMVFTETSYKYYEGKDTDGDGKIDEDFRRIGIGSIISATSYDAARANMGFPWCMPTAEQQAELITNCSIQKAQENGIFGITLKGTNGGQIFLPCNGMRDFYDLNDGGTDGCYWSGSVNPNRNNRAFVLYFETGKMGNETIEVEDYGSEDIAPYRGLGIRAVVTKQ